MPTVRTGALKAGPQQPASGINRDSSNGRAGTRPGTAYPHRRRMRKKQHRKRQHEHDRRNDEPKPTDDRTTNTADPVGTEDRQLRGRRPGQEAARRIGILKLTRIHPAPPLNHQPAQQRDMRRRPPKPSHPDPQPLPRDRPTDADSAESPDPVSPLNLRPWQRALMG
jgi:hypothetical protein